MNNQSFSTINALDRDTSHPRITHSTLLISVSQYSVRGTADFTSVRKLRTAFIQSLHRMYIALIIPPTHAVRNFRMEVKSAVEFTFSASSCTPMSKCSNSSSLHLLMPCNKQKLSTIPQHEITPPLIPHLLAQL